MELPCQGITGTDVRVEKGGQAHSEMEPVPCWSMAGGDDLAAEDGAVADRWTGELWRRLPVLVVQIPLLLQVLVELQLLLFGPVPIRWQLPGTG